MKRKFQRKKLMKNCKIFRFVIFFYFHRNYIKYLLKTNVQHALISIYLFSKVLIMYQEYENILFIFMIFVEIYNMILLYEIRLFDSSLYLFLNIHCFIF